MTAATIGEEGTGTAETIENDEAATATGGTTAGAIVETTATAETPETTATTATGTPIGVQTSPRATRSPHPPSPPRARP